MKKFATCLLLFWGKSVFASEDVGKLVTHIGISGNNAHFYVEGNFSEECKYNVVYFPVDTDSGKIAYSTILAAKTTQSKLRRITYSIDPSTQICTLRLVEIE